MFIKELLEDQARKHTPEWANKIIRNARMFGKPLVERASAELGMAYLLSNQDMSPVRDMFITVPRSEMSESDYNNPLYYKEGMFGVKFKPLPIWEKPKNIIIAEMKKIGVNIDVRSTDPSSAVSRKKDEAFIKNKSDIESHLSQMYTAIGKKPVKMDEYEARFNEKFGFGNLDVFSQMGLDENNPEDLKSFFEYFYKLGWETNVETLLDSLHDYNHSDDIIDMWATDFLSKKAACAQLYVSPITGELNYSYLAPETIKIWGGGRRKDWNDANAKIVEVSISVKEMLNRMGDAFDFERDIDKLVMAIMFSTSREVTGIHTGSNTFLWRKDNSVTMQSSGATLMNDFMQLRVTLGYVEWVTQEDQESESDLLSPKVETDGNYFQNNQPSDKSKYSKKAKYLTPTYKAYYLPVSTFDQIMFDFGKLPYQDIEGSTDMTTNFTIVTYKEIGDSIVLASMPLVDLCNKSYYKFVHEFHMAKPRGAAYAIESVMQMADELWSDDEMTKENKMQKMSQVLSQSANRYYKMGIEIDGKVMPTAGQQQIYDLPGGMNQESMNWWKILLDTKDEIFDLAIGNAPLRQGNAPASRNSMNNEFKALENSENSTYYIPDGITFILQSLSTRSIMWCQSIITYKDKDTLAYKWLENLVGPEVLDNINGMNKIAPHRYAIFVESINMTPMRMWLDTAIQTALQSKTINIAQAILVKDIKSPKKAAVALAYMEQKAMRQQQKQAMEIQQAQAQSQQQLAQLEIGKIKLQGDYDIMLKKMDMAQGEKEHYINQQGQLTKQAMKQSGDVDQIYHQAQADIAAQSDQVQQSIAPAPPPPQQAPQGAPQMPWQKPATSGIREAMENAQPMTTGFNQS